jgi:hypothetical protein
MIAWIGSVEYRTQKLAPSFSSLFISPISDIPLAKNTPHLPALAWVEHSGSAAHISFLIIYLSSGFAALLFLQITSFLPQLLQLGSTLVNRGRPGSRKSTT